MFSLKGFLEAATADTILEIMDNGIRHITSIRDLSDEFDDRTFSHWQMYCGRLRLYLD